jgi:multiphosphoryl transfer protein
MTVVRLFAPLAGWATPLAEVPDPAFAEGLVGDGIAVDPTESELKAPCDGVVVALHRARHACTIRASNGAEVLLHIGVDTVGLNGEGFTAVAREGQSVKAGDPLIRFDMDRLLDKAPSLLTMMVIVNGDDHPVVDRLVDAEVGPATVVLSVGGDAATEAAPAAEPDADAACDREVPLMIANGLHARPAAALAAVAREHPGTVSIACQGRTANAKSVVALIGLGTVHGDILTVSAGGDGAASVVERLAAAIAAGLGDPVVPLAPAAAPTAQASSTGPAPAIPAVPFTEGAEVVLRGTTAVPGLAIGPAVRLFHAAKAIPEAGAGTEAERGRLAAALATLAARLDEAGKGKGETAQIFRAHRALLDDPDLTEGTEALIAQGKSAEWAWNETVERAARILGGLADARLAERAADLRDLQGQVLDLLGGRDTRAVLADFPAGGILVSDEVLPSELTAVPDGRLAGVCMGAGGATSHAVILAATMGIPCIVAAGPETARVPDGATVIVDGAAGEIRVFPAVERQAAVRQAVAERAQRREANRRAASTDCRLADGTRIEVFANVGKIDDARKARDEGAEGCGLLRTEFLFLGRGEAPSEDEQFRQYQAIADALDGRPVIIRTLDAGGDKPLAYFHIPQEENPALGVRGVRATLKEPWLLRTQIRAILRVRPYGVCKIMVPMIAAPEELRAVRAMIEEERAALGRAEPIEMGAMIEVPAAALTADLLGETAAFFSIGTNDLTQYTLAMDRGNPALASGIDTLHPGVLRLIRQVTLGAAKHGRPVAVCGGSASDPVAATILVGLGVTELSCAPAAIPEVKALMRTLTLAKCQELAEAALKAENAQAVRRLVAGALSARS